MSKESKSDPPLALRIARGFNYEGKPYKLCGDVNQRYRPFLVCYKDNLHIPRKRVFMTARQVAKTTNVAALSFVYALLVKGFRTLVVLPWQDQAKDFASRRLNPFRDETPLLKSMLSGKESRDIWNRKTLSNRSQIDIEWVLSNPNRARGGTYDMLVVDEAQDMDEDSMPIITSCLMAGHYRIQQLTGTPYSEHNYLNKEFERGSMAEWVSPCDSCGYENVASVEEDLLEMLGEQGPICAKPGCGSPLDTDGPNCRFVHAHPERRNKVESYHIPQPILPLHWKGEYGRMNWEELMADMKNWSVAKFFNERLGTPKDSGGVLITKSDIKDKCNLKVSSEVNKPNFTAAKGLCSKIGYEAISMGIDWGGHGVADDATSKTAITVMGARKGNFTVDTLLTKDFDPSTPVKEEFEFIDKVFRVFSPFAVYHDRSAAHIYEYTLSAETSVPGNKVLGVESYVKPGGKVFEIKHVENERPYRRMHKTKGILLFFEAIRKSLINFDAWKNFEYVADSYTSVMGEVSTSKKRTGDILLITKKSGTSNDLLISSVFAFHGLVQKTGNYDLFSTK